MSWARARLLAAYANDETAVVEDVNTLIDLNLKVIRGNDPTPSPTRSAR